MINICLTILLVLPQTFIIGYGSFGKFTRTLAWILMALSKLSMAQVQPEPLARLLHQLNCNGSALNHRLGTEKGCYYCN